MALQDGYKNLEVVLPTLLETAVEQYRQARENIQEKSGRWEEQKKERWKEHRMRRYRKSDQLIPRHGMKSDIHGARSDAKKVKTLGGVTDWTPPRHPATFHSH